MKLQDTIVAIAIGMFGALAASGQAGRREVQTASTLTRAEVHAGAVQSPPAGGEQAFAAAPMAPASQQAARAVASDALAREYRTSANEDG